MNYLSDLGTKKRTWDSLRKKFRKDYSFVASNCFDETGLDVVQLDEDLDKHLVNKNLIKSETELEELSMKEKLMMFMVEEDIEKIKSLF